MNYTPQEWYAERLRDNRWIRKRDSIKIRDNYTCQNCGDTERKQDVHHKEYLKGKEPWEYPDELLETLCDKCHKGEHALIIPTLTELTQLRLELLDKINYHESTPSSITTWKQGVSMCEAEAIRLYGTDLKNTLTPETTNGGEQKVLPTVC